MRATGRCRRPPPCAATARPRLRPTPRRGILLPRMRAPSPRLGLLGRKPIPSLRAEARVGAFFTDAIETPEQFWVQR